MALELPKSRAGVRQIQIQKRQVPIEQIMAVRGQSPVAAGIDEVGKVLGGALQRQAELRRQGQQVAAISKATGVDLTGITDPAIADKVLTAKTNMEKANSYDFAGLSGDNKSMIVLNKRTGQTELRPLPEGFSPKTANSNLQSIGGTFESASPEEQHLAKALAQGNILTSDIGQRQRGRVVALANEYAIKNNMPFQSYTGNVRKGMAENLAYGGMGKNALSLNTALGHTQDAMDAFQKIGNTNQAWLNTPINKLKAATNDPNVISLGLNLNALQGELANVFKNSGGTDQEIASWREYLNRDLTPAQAVAAGQKIQELLLSRQNALEYQQQNVMGNSNMGRQLLSPKGRAIMQNLKSGNSLMSIPTPNSGMITIKASDGSMHRLPAVNLEKARQRDPGLQVMQ